MNSWERTGMCLVCPTNQLFIFLGGFIFFLKKCLPTTLNRQRLQRMMQYTVLSMSLNFPLGLLVFRRHDTPPTFCSWHRVGERGRRRHKSRLQHSPSITPLRICLSMQESYFGDFFFPPTKMLQQQKWKKQQQTRTTTMNKMFVVSLAWL